MASPEHQPTTSHKTDRKVMVIAHNHPRLFPGGGEIMAYRLFEALNRLGTTVVVATHDVHLIKKVPNSLIMRLDKGRLFDPTGALRYPPRPGGTPSAQRAQDGGQP